jgi:hypothetical protein
MFSLFSGVYASSEWCYGESLLFIIIIIINNKNSARGRHSESLTALEASIDAFAGIDLRDEKLQDHAASIRNAFKKVELPRHSLFSSSVRFSCSQCDHFRSAVETLV